MTCPNPHLNIECPATFDPVCVQGSTYPNVCEAAKAGWYSNCNAYQEIGKDGTCQVSKCPKSALQARCNSLAVDPICTSTGEVFKNRCEAEAQGWRDECRVCANECKNGLPNACPKNTTPTYNKKDDVIILIIIYVLCIAIAVTSARLLIFL